MKINLRSLFLGSCALVLGCNDPGATEGTPDEGQAVQPVVAAVSLGVTPVAVDARGIPHFVRGGDHMPAMPAATATESARQHLARLAPAWGLRSAAKLPRLDAIGEIPVLGGTVVRFRQVIDGLPVEPTSGGEVRVLVKPDGAMVAASGVVRSNDSPRSVSKFVDQTEADAIARAVGDKYKTTVSAKRLARSRTASDGSNVVTGTSGSIDVSVSRARKAWVPQGKSLVQAWVVEAASSNDSNVSDAYRTVISPNGKVLSRTNLKADAAFSYRVYADNTGEMHPFDGPQVDSSPNTNTPILFPNHRPFPAYRAPNLVTVDGLNHPAGGGAADPWLAAGATSTKGNNVDAYTDATPPNGPSAGDFRANVTAPGVFDRTYDFTKSAIDNDDQQKFGITELFYLINWMHDFWYDGGFTEAAGNGQASNYGRGGEEGDAIKAEAQDNARGPNGGSRNNANMGTLSDGVPSTMQVFVWDNEDHRVLTAAGQNYDSGTAVFGPTKYDSGSAALILANDGAGTSATDGCEPLTGTYTGKIVVIDRGSCDFKLKTLHGQQAGALGVIIASNQAGPAPGMADSTAITDAITIPVLSVTQADGMAIKAAIDGTAKAQLSRNPDPDLDGTLDITVIGHEFGHFVHHRLSTCDTDLCGAMSEGWADFSALLVSSRAGDDFDAQFPMGVFSVRGTSDDPAFYGIRRAPYTTNHAVNALSFRHMAEGEALPGAPFQGGDPSGNSEVHAAGEVWASMLWEGYVALQKAGGSDVASFEATRLKMRQYVVAGLLMAPPDATPTETRDSLLTAVRMKSQADHDLLYAAYAKRGFGSCAESPDRNSSDFNPIVESAELKGRVGVTGTNLTRPTSCDTDESLDAGEVMQIQIPVTNPGPAKMTNVTAKLNSNLVEVDGEDTIAIGDLDAYNGAGMATFNVKLKPGTGRPTESDITLDIASDDGCRTVTVPVVARFNSDDFENALKSDNFNAGISAWTPTYVPNATTDTGQLWTHERLSGLEADQFGEDSPIQSDTSLVSPKMTASDDDDVVLSFDHLFLFESLNGGKSNERAFDGGVIEYSTDADEPTGGTWHDISELADPGYNRTLDGTAETTDNVLAGKPAFGFINDSFPDVDTVELDLGDKLAGKTFRIRFRIATDSGNGAGPSAGWQIDNFAASGITNAPFPALVADRNSCNLPGNGSGSGSDDDHDDGGCQTGGMSTASMAALLGALGLVLRRRRKTA